MSIEENKIKNLSKEQLEDMILYHKFRRIDFEREIENHEIHLRWVSEEISKLKVELAERTAATG